MASGSESDASTSSAHEEGSKQRGITVNSKTNNQRKMHVSYNRHGVAIGNEGTKLVTFEGLVARSMVRITFESWRDVEAKIKQGIWDHVKVNTHFNN